MKGHRLMHKTVYAIVVFSLTAQILNACSETSVEPGLELPPFDTNESGTFIDTRDGRTYSSVEIGAQVWMAENLAYQTDSESWCYGDDLQRCEEFGRLYSWGAATTACPTGWRLPSESDWNVLEAELTPDAGLKLREGGSSGFEAKMAGVRHYDGGYAAIGGMTSFWTSTPYTDDHAAIRLLATDTSEIIHNGLGHEGGISVRCLSN